VYGERGLARFDGEIWTFFQPPADLGPIRALAIGPDGTLWAGGNEQIAHLGESGWIVYPSVEGVQAIAFAADGSLWLATSNGVAHFQPPH